MVSERMPNRFVLTLGSSTDLGLAFDEEKVAADFDLDRLEGEVMYTPPILILCDHLVIKTSTRAKFRALCVSSAVSNFKISTRDGNSTAIAEPFKLRYSIQSFEFIVKALSKGALVRLGVIEVRHTDPSNHCRIFRIFVSTMLFSGWNEFR